MAGEPTSVSVHGAGSGPGGGGGCAPMTWTLSKAAVLTWPMLWEVSNRPTSTGPVMDRVAVPIWVQWVPSLDSYEVKLLPDLVSFSHLLGAVKPASVAPVAECDPVYCIRTPWPTAGTTGGSGDRQPSASQPAPLTSGVLGLTSGATSASTKFAPATVDCLIMSPALAHGEELDWYRTRATMEPSPVIVWYTKCDWSFAPYSSAPAPSR